MRIHLRASRPLVERMRRDLGRKHPFASERVGFAFARFGSLPEGDLLVLLCSYEPVSDSDYIDDPSFGAVIGSAAFRRALEVALVQRVGVFHTHMHDHPGKPRPSSIDIGETRRFVPDFFNVRPELMHGAAILSRDSLSARCWRGPRGKPVEVASVTVVGVPVVTIRRHRGAP